VISVRWLSIKGLKQERDLGVFQVWERVQMVAVRVLDTQKKPYDQLQS